MTKLQRYPKVFSEKNWKKFTSKVFEISNEKEGSYSTIMEDALLMIGKLGIRLEVLIRDLEQRVADLEDK